MRKTAIPIILTILTVATLVSGCSLPRLGGAVRNVVSQEKKLADFTRIDIKGIFEVRIVQANSFSITVSSESSLLDYIAVSKEGETLRIYLNPRHIFTDFTSKAKTFKAEITMPALAGLNLSGATSITMSGFKSSNDFSLNITGASSLNMNDMEVGNTEFKVSGASQVTGSLKANAIKSEVSGASSVELEGVANSIVLNASGASKVNLAKFPLNDASVQLGGASEVTLTVKENLDAILSDASVLYFQGNPVMGNISVSGGSTIKQR